MMSRQAVAKQYEELKETLVFAMRIIAYITIPAAIGLIVLRVPVINVLFERGAFDAFSTRMTAYALSFYAVGLIAFAWVKVVVPAYYAQQDTRTPVKIAVGAVAINIGLNFLLLHRLSYGGSIALAGSLAAFCHVGMLLLVFRMRRGRIGLRQVSVSVGKILLAGAVMGLYCQLAIQWFGHDPADPALWQGLTIWRRVYGLVSVILSGVAVYLGLTYVLRCPEIREIFPILRSKTIGEKK
jgi:putative peptidoglycan lipid II flippase